MKRKWTTVDFTLIIVVAAIYAAALIAFSAIKLGAGISLRPANALQPVFGILFGVPGAIGIALGNFVNDIYTGFFSKSFAGLIGNFLGAYIPYLIVSNPRLRTGKSIAEYAIGVVGITSAVVAGSVLINVALSLTAWPLAKNVLQVGAGGYGYLMSSLGAGALTGAFILAFRKRGEPRLAPLVTAALVLCAATASMFFVRSFWLACIGLFVMGVSQILFTADTNTTVQMVVPDELRGRVMSLYQLMFAGTVPFGSLFTGAVIERWGGSAGFLVGGLLGLLLALLLRGYWLGARSRSPLTSEA